MEVSQQGDNSCCVSEIRVPVQRNRNNVLQASFDQRTVVAIYWETNGRTKSDRSRARCLNIQGQQRAITKADNQYFSLCARKNRTSTPAELKSCSLYAQEGEYQGQPYVKGFSNGIFKRGEPQFTSLSRHAIAWIIGDSFVLQDDNARPHRAHIMDFYPEYETIQRLQWAARSPDLKRIKLFRTLTMTFNYSQSPSLKLSHTFNCLVRAIVRLPI
ncbi:hypothetical protein TNCV_3468101 [Trichonephila clavipes]|nr:hypothetical protein TNCV_3468101 [Trichonephila clavipes]